LLFSMRHLGSLRMYESVLRTLAGAGHDIQILANRRDTIGSGIDPEVLLGDLPQIRWTWEELHPDAWSELAAAVRIWLDYLRYFEPRYADAPRLRMRTCPPSSAASLARHSSAPNWDAGRWWRSCGVSSARCRASRRSTR
jgi:hypothetical protein